MGGEAEENENSELHLVALVQKPQIFYGICFEYAIITLKFLNCWLKRKLKTTFQRVDGGEGAGRDMQLSRCLAGIIYT